MKKKLIKILIALSFILSIFNSVIVKANDNITLSRNDQLTNISFNQKNENYFVKNNISTLHFSFENNSTLLKLRGDIELDLYGLTESVNAETYTGYIGYFEGVLEDGTFLSVNTTYVDNEMLATLTVGYLGDEYFGTTYFGQITEKIKKIDDIYTQSLMTVNQIEDIEGISDTFEQQPSVSIASVDADIVQKGLKTVSSGGYVIGQLSVYHSNELQVQGNMITTAKVNTKSSNVLHYLANQGYNTTAMYIAPIQFDITIKSFDSKLVSVTDAVLPKNLVVSYTISIPFPNSSGYSTIPVKILANSTALTRAYSTNAVGENQFSWTIKKPVGWGPSEFDISSSNKAMATQVTYTYQGSVTSTLSKSLTSTGIIKYKVTYYPDPEDDSQKTIYVTTPKITITTPLTVVS